MFGVDYFLMLIKPHHLLDIFKLYGAGREWFVPDRFFGHDFFRVGNLILKKPGLRVRFTLGADEICGPCKFNVGGKCTDGLAGNFSKESWNRRIDRRLMAVLEIEEGTEMTVGEYAMLALEKLGRKEIKAVWRERPKAETARRVNFLRKGLEKYLGRLLDGKKRGGLVFEALKR